MDQGHHHVNISPLFVGLLGVISGAIIVATFHCILVACRDSQSETSQPPRVYRRTIANNQENYNPTSSSSSASNNASTSTSTSRSVSMMHSLDVHKFSKEFKEGTCAVCLGEFQEDEDIKILPECAHVFHVSCIDMWLYSQANCPLCRAVTTPRGHHVVVTFPEPVGIVA